MIKAFSTISAYSLESDVAGERRQVYVSGNDRNAVDLVVQLAESIGFSAIRQGSLGAGQALEKTSHQLFVQWQKPLLVAAIILFLWFTYAVIRFYFIKSPPFKWDNLPLFVFNKVKTGSLFFHSFIRLIHSFIQLIHSLIHPFIPSSINSCNHSLTHFSFVNSFRPIYSLILF